MGAPFDQKSGTFLFDSDGTPINSAPLQNSKDGSALLPRYDSIVYRNRHLSYVFDRGNVYFQLNLSYFWKYSSILRIPTDIKSKTGLEKACERDIIMSKNLAMESCYHSIFGTYLDISELESRSRELEGTLGSLENRINILDKNQQYLAKTPWDNRIHEFKIIKKWNSRF